MRGELVGSVLVLRWLGRRSGAPRPEQSGFGTWTRVLIATVIGFALGLVSFVGQRATSTDPIVVTNAFLGTFGVTQALAAAGGLKSLDALQVPLAGTATTTAAVLMVGYWWVRRSR